MIYAQPGAAFQAILDGAPTGRVGQVGVQVVRNSDGAIVTARTAANITEVIANSGVYLFKGTTPSTSGAYTVVWDDGAISPTTVTTEEMVVSATVAVSEATSGYDLCTLGDVRQMMQKTASDHEQDAFITKLVTWCSFEVMDYCERQFAPVEAHVTKTFTWERDGELCNFTPWDLQSLDDPETSVKVDTDNQTAYTCNREEYRLGPRQKRNGVYTKIRLRPFGASFGSIPWSKREAQITGTWGFPTIPTAVADATALTVVHRLTVNTAAFRKPDEAPSDVYAQKLAIPSEACRLLMRYKRTHV